MSFYRPRRLTDALAIRAQAPEALPLAGGTDVMVEVNAGRLRPEAVLDLTAVPELAEWDRDGDSVRIGATLSYTRLLAELPDAAPALATAARTVGSPQIRNRATIGGNLGTASPAGDALPPLFACGATVEVASVRGHRHIPIDQLCTGVKRTALAADELICAVHLPSATGPQQFAKVGGRNAMVIANCSFALALRPDAERVGTGIGAAAPTPLRAAQAEAFLAGELAGNGLWTSRAPLPESLVRRFGTLVAEAASPIDDLRGTAAYRRHALSVIARRTLSWAWEEHRSGGGRPDEGSGRWHG